MKIFSIKLFLQTSAVFAAVVCFTACTFTSGNPNKEEETNAWQQKRLRIYNDSLFPKLGSIIRNGDLVTRLGTDITSEMLRKMNKEDQSFSHCGIASIENDSIFIYHAIGGEFNPDQKLKRDLLYAFGHPFDTKSIGVFNMNMNDKVLKKLISQVHIIYNRGIPFDMEFDYSTDDRLYCAEFVSKCFSYALNDSSWFHFTHHNHFKYVAIDNLLSGNKMVAKIHLNY